MLDANIQKHIDLLVQRYPVLDICKEDIEKAYRILEECYTHDGKLLIAGNGGSAADSEHIAGELMKRFKTPRPVPADFAEKLQEVDSVRGPELAKNLERGLMAIPLVAHEALSTAYINDVDGLGVFAQQLYGFGRPGDVFLGIGGRLQYPRHHQVSLLEDGFGKPQCGLCQHQSGQLYRPRGDWSAVHLHPRRHRHGFDPTDI